MSSLTFQQSSQTDPVVEGQDFVVNYLVVNTGDAIATKIEISDRYDANRYEWLNVFHFHKQLFLYSFETITNIDPEGNVSFELEELAPGNAV